MKRLKPVHISILTIIVFVAALIIGMQTDWWQTEGRKTPLDDGGGKGLGQNSAEEQSFDNEDEDHIKTQVSGSSTVQDAIDLGLTQKQLESILGGEIDDKTLLIKDIAKERGLQFGVIKDELNVLLG